MEVSEFQLEAAKLALKKMFEGSHFDICTVDKCLAITRAVPDKEVYKGLHAIHCVHWKDMPPEMRKEVFARTLEMITGEGFDLAILDMKFDNMREAFVTVERKGFGKLLRLGKG